MTRKIWTAGDRLDAADLNAAFESWTGVSCRGQATTACPSGVVTRLTGALILDGNDPYDFVTAAAPSKVTIPPGLGGVYRMTFSLYIPAGGVGTYRRAQVWRNGAGGQVWYRAGAAAGLSIDVVASLTLGAGDVIECAAQHDSGAPLACYVQSLLVERVGPAL